MGEPLRLFACAMCFSSSQNTVAADIIHIQDSLPHGDLTRTHTSITHAHTYTHTPMEVYNQLDYT